MQVNYPSTGETIILIWFAVSVFIEIVSSIVLWFWLRRRGVKLVYGLAGIPGYMERAYLEWCRSQGRASRALLVWRVILHINVVVAAIFFIPIVSR
jgi:hypothetical protein